MGPLSAVAVSAFLLIFGGNELGWWSARPAVIGAVAIIAMALVLIDTFWHGVLAWRPRRGPVA